MAVLVLLDHTLNHLAAYTAVFSCSKVTVIALLQVYVKVVSYLILKVIKSLLSLGYYYLVHSFSPP